MTKVRTTKAFAALSVPLFKETSKKFLKKWLQLSYGVSNLPVVRPELTPMPNQGSPDKDVLSVRIPRPLKKRLEKLAAKRGLKVAALVEQIITQHVTEITLSPNDYRQIAEETELALKRAAAKGTEKKALDRRYKGKADGQ